MNIEQLNTFVDEASGQLKRKEVKLVYVQLALESMHYKL